MQLIQSFSPTSAAAPTTANADRSTSESSGFDHLLSSISKQESGTEAVKKKPEEVQTDAEPHEETSAQADNLLAMLLNTPAAVPPQPNASQTQGQAPLPAGVEQTLSSNLQALAQNLESQLQVSNKDMLSAQHPTASAAAGLKDLVMEPETFMLASAHEPLIDIPNVTASQSAPVKQLMETSSVSNEMQEPSHVSTPFGQQGWDKAISQRVTWMLQDQLKSATLTVNPPHLGPIQVHIQLDNQQINVQFISGLPEVRQALQDAIPALESLMNQSGLQLGQSDVSDQQKPSQDQSPAAKPQGQVVPDEEVESNPSQLTKSLKMGSGLLSTFA